MSTTTTTPASTARTQWPVHSSRLAIAAGSAAVLNLITYGIASASGASMAVTAPTAQEIPALLTVIATLVPMAVAGLLTWIIACRRPGFRRFAAWAGLVFGVLTAASPMASSEDIPTGAVLGLMHVIVGIAWFMALQSPRATEQEGAASS
ncbi:DUF6069 family protein [Arthrobacter sp. NPDC056691]|uniref:DUF6069 family protein n=1 Tax=Arthrobacter sp. NPDC056691 TaxID=3345913 RepID=UPI003670DC86